MSNSQANSKNNIVDDIDEDSKYITCASLDDDCDVDLDSSITLISSEGQRFDCTKRQAFLSNVIKTAAVGEATASEIQLNVNSHILSFIVEYLRFRNGSPADRIVQPLPINHKFRQLTSEENANFLYKVAGCPEDQEPPKSTTKSRLFALITAADYLQINCLLYLSGAWLASMAKLSKLEEVPDVVRVESDPFDESRVEQYTQYLQNQPRDRLVFFLNPLEDPALEHIKDLPDNELITLSLDAMRKKNISLL